MARNWNLPLKAGVNAIISIMLAREMFRKGAFFPLFFQHARKAQEKSLGLDTRRRGQDVPSGPRSCARATSLPGGGAGQEVPIAPYSPDPRLHVRPAGPEAPPSFRSPAGPLGAKEGELPSWRERLRSAVRADIPPAPPAAGWRAAPRKHRLKQSLSGEIRTLCKVIRFFLNAVW